MRIRKEDFTRCNNELMAWLRDCRNDIVAGKEIPLDPFYERTALFTEEMVDGIFRDIEVYIQGEIDRSSIYHAEHQGVPAADLRVPAYTSLPWSQRLAIVQGMDKVCNPYRMTEAELAAEAEIAEAMKQAELARLEERRANLARDPHFYDYEQSYYEYGD